MNRTTKYVALDVHQATTVASVREQRGRVIARAILPTEATAIVEFFRGMRGSVRVAFEEGTHAQWLHDLLAPIADRVIVCDRRGEPRSNMPSAVRSVSTVNRSPDSTMRFERRRPSGRMYRIK